MFQKDIFSAFKSTFFNMCRFYQTSRSHNAFMSNVAKAHSAIFQSSNEKFTALTLHIKKHGYGQKRICSKFQSTIIRFNAYSIECKFLIILWKKQRFNYANERFRGLLGLLIVLWQWKPFYKYSDWEKKNRCYFIKSSVQVQMLERENVQCIIAARSVELFCRIFKWQKGLGLFAVTIQYTYSNDYHIGIHINLQWNKCFVNVSENWWKKSPNEKYHLERRNEC